jgi:ketosteroid isomerase-like protein
MAISTTDPVSEITALLKARKDLIHDKDAGALIAQSAPDVVSFDALPPLARQGADALREKLATWFGGYDGPIGFTIHDLAVTANDEVGFAHYLYRVTGTTTNGAAVDMWLRATVGLVKRDGIWQVTHEHTSVPFDAASGQAALQLTPERDSA